GFSFLPVLLLIRWRDILPLELAFPGHMSGIGILHGPFHGAIGQQSELRSASPFGALRFAKRGRDENAFLGIREHRLPSFRLPAEHPRLEMLPRWVVEITFVAGLS